jgi:hypothetical protein
MPSEALSSVLLVASARLDRTELASDHSGFSAMLAFCDNGHRNALCLQDSFALIRLQYVYAHQEASGVDRYGCQMVYLASAMVHDRRVRSSRFIECFVITNYYRNISSRDPLDPY